MGVFGIVNSSSLSIVNIQNIFNSLRPRRNSRHFADDIFKCIYLNENAWIAFKNSPKIVPKFPINDIPALVQIMAWPWPGDKSLSEPMMVSLVTHICVTRSQWVNWLALRCVWNDLDACRLFPVSKGTMTGCTLRQTLSRLPEQLKILFLNRSPDFDIRVKAKQKLFPGCANVGRHKGLSQHTVISSP